MRGIIPAKRLVKGKTWICKEVSASIATELPFF
ncbi:hypothetical protein EV691_1794 [Azotobacter chroococcum]|jgi:hypothetical protein|uniref:Uncharacterized protein n=1 Tax=Azotobacter chroococcum TaxID=353 RepID=A0A4R1NSP3_9GAMM|nr:hypothetical protein EV691_1794 [Azotobacter chroococcum]